MQNNNCEIEYLDLVDDNDKVIGSEERNKIVSLGIKNCRAIHIFVFNSKGELVVPQRSENRRICPNCYDFSVSGYVSAGEDYIESAYRELEEELGINNVELKEIGYFKPRDIGTTAFCKLYELVYDGKINMDIYGIKDIYYFDLNTIYKMSKESPEKFKGDFSPIMNWYIKKYKSDFLEKEV